MGAKLGGKRRAENTPFDDATRRMLNRAYQIHLAKNLILRLAAVGLMLWGLHLMIPGFPGTWHGGYPPVFSPRIVD